MAKHGTSGGHRQHDATPLREFIQEQWEAWDTVHYNMKEEESVGRHGKSAGKALKTESIAPRASQVGEEKEKGPHQNRANT